MKVHKSRRRCVGVKCLKGPAIVQVFVCLCLPACLLACLPACLLASYREKTVVLVAGGGRLWVCFAVVSVTMFAFCLGLHSIILNRSFVVVFLRQWSFLVHLLCHQTRRQLRLHFELKRLEHFRLQMRRPFKVPTAKLSQQQLSMNICDTDMIQCRWLTDFTDVSFSPANPYLMTYHIQAYQWFPSVRHTCSI